VTASQGGGTAAVVSIRY